jgi:hypothetical protein
MKKIVNISIFFVLIYIIGCNDEFDPVTEYDEKIVLVGILNNKDEPQYIKVQKSYSDLNTDDNLKKTSCYLELIENTNTLYEFYILIIPEISDYFVLYNSDFRTKKTVYYAEVIQKGDILAYATTTMPSNLGEATYKNNSLTVVLSSKDYSYTYEYHVYIDYKVTSGTDSISKRYEVPIGFNISGDGKDTSLVFPELEKKLRTADDTVKIPNNHFIYAMSKLLESVAGNHLLEIKCFVVFTTIEANLVDYLFRGFNDNYSVRLDQPNWTNVVGGEGIFGAVSYDSIDVSTALPGLVMKR